VTPAWTTIVVLMFATIVLKGAGPAAVGGRELPRPVMRVIALFAPALLAALIVWETLGGEGRSLTVDARVVGVAVAGLLLTVRNSMVEAMIGAAAATALVRLIA
jgi:branched-subunit amino acid transport protein